MHDLLEILGEHLSAVEIGELMKPILKYHENSENELNDYLVEKCICPVCLSEEFREEKSWEETDRDGNRGREYTWLICKQCGYEL